MLPRETRLDQSCVMESQRDKPSLSMIVCSKTYASGKCEFQVIGYVCVVGDGVVNALVQQVLVAVEVLGNTQPETEQLLCVLARCVSDLPLLYLKITYRCRANHMIVRHNPQLPPAVHHSEQTEMVVAHFLCRLLAKAELVKQLIMQE